MPYPAGHREQVRRKIVDSARRLFNQDGFERVSVDSIMAHAGLTRGGFYSYFGSKSDLYAEVMRCFFTDPEWEHRWAGVEFNAAAEAGPQIVRAYLSRGHFDDVENSCPLIALPNDVARSDATVKAAFETVFKAMVALLGRDVRNSTQSRENADGHRRSLHRRHGRGPVDERPRSRRPAARGCRQNRVAAGRLDQTEIARHAKTQVILK